MIDIDQLKARNNIVDVINSLVPLKKAGKNYQACCPFHSEKSPSFTVNEQKQFYHCFSCGASGDVVGFVQDFYNVEFIEAAKILGGEHDELHNIQSAAQQRPARINLPMSEKPHDINKINEFLDNKCELVNGCYFYSAYQAVRLTDINGNIVSCALIQGKGFENKWFNKKFIYGSCVIFGEIQKDGITHLCETYQDAMKVYLDGNGCSVCFFDPLNLFFIADSVKRLTKNIIVIADTDETVFQCDKLNLIDCKYYGE